MECKNCSKKFETPEEMVCKAINELARNLTQGEEKTMDKDKENPMCKCNTDEHCKNEKKTNRHKRNYHCALKMSFILNICLIILSIIIFVSSCFLIVIETTDFESETIIIDQ